MRLIGTSAYGIRTPIIDKGDNLVEIITDSLIKSSKGHNIEIEDNDIIGVTEAVVAKAQGNFATTDDIGIDIKNKYGDKEIGLVFPILSRNRFSNILKGIVKGAKKVYVLLQCPKDEVGNPIMDLEVMDDIEDELSKGPIRGERFKKITNSYIHPFTGADYISLYEEAGDNVEVYVSNDPRDILRLTKNVLVCEIHSKDRTKARLIKAGAETIHTLDEILSEPINGSGYNSEHGVLGSNLSSEDTLKLFPRNSQKFAEDLQASLLKATGKHLEVLVYGDGAFKDPACGIWELADPVVSPGFTKRLGGQPKEIKLKYVADNTFSHLSGDEKQKAVAKLIRENTDANKFNEGTTPRRYADLLGSLCDLMSGSGDKGTPAILIKGYFDNFGSK